MKIIRLSVAEFAIMKLASAGLSTKEIAVERRTSVNTVRQQRTTAKKKLGAKNQAHAAALFTTYEKVVGE